MDEQQRGTESGSGVLSGYSGADQRTAHAKEMGLIEDTMDLSQPGYYKWFYEKCLGFMKDHGVNYYKWDKAGAGVSPHFMSLIQCGRELKKHDPKLFINVTVGTWPSPFWLNHIDCTWRTGTGDVAWYGVGDKREPPVYMEPGDVIEIDCGMVGTLVNPIVAEGDF